MEWMFQHNFYSSTFTSSLTWLSSKVLTMLKNAIERLSPRNLFKRKQKFPIPKQEADLQTLDNFILNTNVLTKLSIDSSHPIHKVSIQARSMVGYSGDLMGSKKLIALDNYLGNSIAEFQNKFSLDDLYSTGTSVSTNKSNIETAVRLYFAREYFKRLRKSIDDKDINIDNFTITQLNQLVDVIIRGTASERIETQLTLYGPELNQERMQECFYSLYEPEIHTYTTIFLQNPALHPHHKKNMPVFAKTYLLDKHDLNMKLRCVLAWSDPTFSGFQSVSDTASMDVPQLLKARRDFYEGGTEVGLQYLRDYVGNRNEYYNTKAENRLTMQKGAAFFVVTCLLDWLVCSI